MNFLRRNIATLLLLALPVALATGQSTANITDEQTSRVALALSTAEYPATPGDIMSVSYLSAASTATVRFSIDADYSVDLGFFGSIDARGMTYLALQQKVAELVKAVYPNSYPKINLLSTGSFKVTIDGAVNTAGEVSAWGLTRLSQVVAGRIHAFGSDRYVVLRRATGRSSTYDLFIARRYGDLTQNPYILPGDRISIGVSSKKVVITGEVKRPGTYELLDGDTLYELIEEYAQGITDRGDGEQVVLTRYEAGKDTPVSTVTVDYDDGGSSLTLQNFDVVAVPSIADRLPVVYLEGAVEEPGDADSTEEVENSTESQRIRVTLRDGDTLYSVLSRSKGKIRENADLRRAVVSRESASEPIEIDMEALLYQKNLEVDIDVVAGDRIVIPFGAIEVFITGEVKNSDWVTVTPLTRLSQLVNPRFTDYSSNRDILITSSNGSENRYDLFRAARFGEQEQNPYLEPGDSITVERAEKRVTIVGEVERPGAYTLLDGEFLGELISLYGGGFTTLADTEEVKITRYSGVASSPASVLRVDGTRAVRFPLRDLDRVEVVSSLRLLPVVYLDGAVEGGNKIRIQLKTGDTLYSILRSSRDRLSPSANLSKGFINREGRSAPIEVDMESLLYRYSDDLDVRLVAGDQIIVPYGNIEVFLKGEVAASRWITIEPLTRLSGLVSGHLTEYSSNRDITVRSETGDEKQYDLFRASRLGEKEQNPYLQVGDTIIVNRAERKVSIAGQVERPGTYQLLEDENLNTLIEFYGGGFTTLADTKDVRITRYSSDLASPSRIEQIDTTTDVTSAVILQNLDQVTVASSLRYLPVVYLDGAVEGGNRIRIQLKTGDTLYSILRTSQDRLSPSADLTKGFINREGRSAPIEVDMESLLYRHTDELDVRLEAGDQIIIPYGNIEVFLQGEVAASRWLTIEPLTRLSGLVTGHLTEYSSTRDITIRSETGDEKQYDLFRASRLGEKEQNPYLQVGDTIIVNRAGRKVSITGEVERPGTYQLLAGENLGELIEFYGGGFTTLADTKEVRLTRYSANLTSPSHVEHIDTTTDEATQVVLQNLDQVSVASSLRYLPVVYLEGAVFTDLDLQEESQLETQADSRSSQRVRVTFREGDTLYAVLRSSEKYLKTDADLSKGFINRDGESSAIEIDMEKLLHQYDESLDVALKPGDRIVVPYGNIEVFLTGEVQTADWITIEPLTRLSSLVSGRLTEYSSNRDIAVISANGDKKQYDLFRASRLGEKEQNPYLRTGDTVVVYRADRKVTISGELERPGQYQPLAGENLKTLVEFYGGGFTTLADRSDVRITRYGDEISSPSRVEIVDADTDTFTSFSLENMDQIEVFSTLRNLPVVYLDGAVAGGAKRRIRLRDGDTLYSVLNDSKALIAENADLSRGFISREGLSDPIEIDFERLLYRYNRDLDIDLEEGDRIIIPFGNLEVFLKGEVLSSRWINIEPLTRLSDLVSGHLTAYSSTRDILVRSLNGDEKTYDLFLASRLGDKAQDPYLESGDTVEVGRIERKVTLTGEIERPGVYQLLEGENLGDLISFYGRGFTETADPRGIEVVTYETDDESITGKQYIDLTSYDVGEVSLSHRDIVSIPSNLRLLPYVFFEGAVSPEESAEEATILEGSSQFRYRYHTGELLSEALENISARFSPEADLKNGYVERVSGNTEMINMEELLRREETAEDLILEPYDRIVIPFKQYFVIVAGGVNNPGRYPYIPNRTYKYYIDLAGGFDSNSHIGNAVNITDISDTRVSAHADIEPEMKITAPYNNPLYFINQLSGVLGVVGSVISIIAVVLSVGG